MTSKMLASKSLYSVSAAAAFLMFKGSDGASTKLPIVGQVGEGEVCAFDSCKPMTNWWCVHGGAWLYGYCDPEACS